MKKHLILATLIAFAATSCSENIKIEAPQGEVAFSALNQKNLAGTKAEVYGPISGTTYPTNEHFGVYAYHHVGTEYDSAPFMGTTTTGLEILKDDNTLVKDGKWRNSTTRYYWPTQGALDFVAYSPYAFGAGTVTGSYTTGIKFEGFTASTDLTKQVDLMACDVISDKTTTSDAVSVPFHHLLSQLKFAVKTASNLTGSNIAAIKVTDLTVHQLKTEGTYTQTSTTVSTGSWAPASTKADYAILSNGEVAVDITAQTSAALGTPVIVVPQDASSYKFISGKDDQNNDINSDIFEIKFTITYSNGTQTDVHKYVATNIAWAKGYAYTYTFEIGVNEITFSPTVSEDWTPASATFTVTE